MCSLLVQYCGEFKVTLGPSDQGHLPLFSSLIEPLKAISYGAINSLVKQAAKMLGLGKGYTAHSLRIGGCTAAVSGGVPMEVVRSIGGWHSSAMELYIRASVAPATGCSAKMGF
jgi:hypothetical protein